MLLLLPPPPQEGTTNVTAKMSSKSNPRTRCRFPPTRTVEKRSSPTPNVHSAGKYDRCCEPNIVVAAFVVIVIEAAVVLAVPFAVIVAGVIVHAASEGRPEQARLIVPVNPVELETVTDVVPEPPGAEINTVDGTEGIAAKNPAVIVNDCDGVLLLALKLESPL